MQTGRDGTVKFAAKMEKMYGDEKVTGRPRLRPPPYDTTWELRCGPANRVRVFYEVDDVLREVKILAIGVKDRNRLFIGGEEYES